jgi:hypothetical protein
LMRALGVKRWLWALEFQQKTGEGWPHWHLLIDLADLKGHKLDLKRAWKFWHEKWGLGGLQLEAKNTKLTSAEHAIFYITKYLTKMPEGGFPIWVLKTHGIRFVQGCRKLGPLVARAKDPKEPADDDGIEREKKYAERRPMLDRMSECGTTSRVYAIAMEKSSGELKSRFVGTLPVSPGDMIEYANLGLIDAHVEVGDVFGKDGVILRSGKVKQLREELELTKGVGQIRMSRIEKKRNQIIIANEFAKRMLDAENAVPQAEQQAGEGAGESGPASGSDPAQAHHT